MHMLMRDAILSLVQSESEYDIPQFTLFPLRTSAQDGEEKKAVPRAPLIVWARARLLNCSLFLSIWV
ncbi:MAG: hypothetical protein ACYTFM_08640 [Planctomycetota bacterium]